MAQRASIAEEETFGTARESCTESSLYSSEFNSLSKSEEAVKPLERPATTSTSPRESSSPSKKSNLYSIELSSSRESEAVVAQHANMVWEETSGRAREENPSELRTFPGEVGSSCNDSSLSISESSSLSKSKGR